MTFKWNTNDNVYITDIADFPEILVKRQFWLAPPQLNGSDIDSLRPSDICVGNLTIVGSYNGLSPGRLQAIIWSNAWILLIWPLGTNPNDFLK